MIFEDGFYHADPHPGNLLVNEHGQLAINVSDKDYGNSAEKVYHGIRVSGLNNESRLIIIFCINCSRKVRVPGNMHISVKCPTCGGRFSVRNGIIY